MLKVDHNAPLLKLTDIKKEYHLGTITLNVLKGVSLEVQTGELLAIVGVSGCGKSTLMNIMGLLDRPTTGELYINQKLIANLSDDELAHLRNQTIGFVFQSYYLLERLNALENVKLPLLYRGISDLEANQAALAMLNKVGMQAFALHKPRTLSGGQQQRIAIARALVTKPTLVLADEPTGALDAGTGQEILKLFWQLNREEGYTFILITHDQQIAKQCLRQIKIYDGLIAE